MPNNIDIPQEFITKFIEIINQNSEDKFPIDLDEVSKWIDHLKRNLKPLIVDEYEQNVDYTITTTSGMKGRPSDIIHLTIPCFKDLCMRLKSKTGKRIRKYFIAVEDAYRTWVNETIYERQKSEDLEIYQKKNQKF